MRAALHFDFRPVQVAPAGNEKWYVSRSVTWSARLEILNDIEDMKIKAPSGDWILPTRNSFAAGYGPFRRLSADGRPQLADSADDDPGNLLETADRFATLFREDASLGATIPWLVGLHLRALEGDSGADNIRRTVIEMLSDGLLPEGYRVIRVDSGGLFARVERPFL